MICADSSSDEIGKFVGNRQFPHGDERRETVHGNRPFIFNAITKFDVFLFSFLVQVGS
jgi:hypothetical protein